METNFKRKLMIHVWVWRNEWWYGGMNEINERISAEEWRDESDKMWTITLLVELKGCLIELIYVKPKKGWERLGVKGMGRYDERMGISSLSLEQMKKNSHCILNKEYGGGEYRLRRLFQLTSVRSRNMRKIWF